MTQQEQPHINTEDAVRMPNVLPLVDQGTVIEHPSQLREEGIEKAVEISRNWLRTATNLVDVAVGGLDVNDLSPADLKELKELAIGSSPQQLDDLCSRAGANRVREVLGIPSHETPA